jgi:hypothetical protein
LATATQAHRADGSVDLHRPAAHTAEFIVDLTPLSLMGSPAMQSSHVSAPSQRATSSSTATMEST